MEGAETTCFIKVWVSVMVSLCYCYVVSKFIAKGTIKLITFLPVLCAFLVLPFNLTSIHFGVTTTFLIAWLANFKLILFAFGLGPLSDPSLSLVHFVALACLPIRIQKSPLPKPLNGPKKANPSPKTSKHGNNKSPLKNATKALILAFVVCLDDYREQLHPNVIIFSLCLFVYVGVEALLAVVGIAARAILRLELKPQFNDPYLSTSLQEFWGRRWNLVVSDILRSTIYNPLLHLSMSTLGEEWARALSILGAFLASGLMHELIVYYLGRLWPNWRFTYFFLIHGFCVVIEPSLKKKFTGTWRLPALISRLLTLAFVVISFGWLVVPQLITLKVDIRAIHEYAILGSIVKDIGWASTFRPFNMTKI